MSSETVQGQMQFLNNIYYYIFIFRNDNTANAIAFYQNKK